MNAEPARRLTFLLVLVFVARSIESHRTHHSFIFNPTFFCEHAAPYKKLCTKVVHTTHNFDMTSPVAVVEANVNAAAQKALRALAKVSTLRKNYPGMGMAASVLHSCRDNYDSAVASLHNTQRILAGHGSHGDLINELTAASTFVGTCSDDLSSVPEMKYPIQNLHTSLEHHVTNCLDLAAVLK